MQELFLMGGNEDVAAAGPTILLRGRDVTVENFRAIAEFDAEQLGAGSERGPSNRDSQQRRSEMPVPTMAALTCPPVSESLPGGSAPTSVGSTSTAPLMAIDEATSGDLFITEQFPKEMHRRERKNARHAAEKRVAELEARRLQLEKDEK